VTRIIRSDTAFSKRRKKPKAKPKGRAIGAVDAIFSLCVREAADWTCARCGTTKLQNQIQCSHLWSRRLRSGRWNPLNAVAHCATCHRFLGENPLLFGEWIKEYLGDRYEAWYALRQVIVKIRPQDREDIYQHYKAVHAEMLRCRERGIAGPIPLVGSEL